jgi:KaiC/GvpD/RAD55 family RecA-like ATPase
MYNIQKRVDQYHKNRADILSGRRKNIPFVGLKKLERYVPGIIGGIMYKITSGSGAGKTQFGKFAFVYQPIIHCIKYNIDYKVIYFALEESEEEFIDGLFIHILKRILKTDVDRFTLNGNGMTMLTQLELEQVEKAKSYVNYIMKNITIIDNKYTPTEMYEECRKIAAKEGVFTVDKFGMEKYTPNNPDQKRLVVTDHLSLVEEEYDKEKEKFLDQSKSMAKWHTRYQRKIITKKWNWAALNIQQQGLDSEKQVFTNKGDTVINKLLPTMDGLANNREVARDDYVIFGLFAPERFKIDNYLGYPICDPATYSENFYDNYRSVTLIKNRFGTPNKTLSLYFDGSYNYFEELPDPSEKAKLKDFIDRIKK